jgi:predicted ATP-dependent Lon-type protease
MDNNSNETISFIQLVKCIIEYYGTTKQKVDNQLKNLIPKTEEDFLDETIGVFGNINLEEMIISVPKEIDEEIKKTFLNQLKKYQNLNQ